MQNVICNSCFENHYLSKALRAKSVRVFDSKNGNKKNVITCIDELLPLYPYDLWNKQLLFDWKIRGERSLSFLFATVVHKALVQNGITTIVPVPPRPHKIEENGWDQIDELCNYLEAFYGVKILRLLERKTTLQMKKLNREERLGNLNKSYFLKSKEEIGAILKKNNCEFPKKVCLLDDVMTTGATLESCGACLKRGGGKEVLAMTLFKV